MWFALIQIPVKWLLQNFAHVTTVVLSGMCKKNYFNLIAKIELQQKEFFRKYELGVKNYEVKRAPTLSSLSPKQDG